MAEQSSSEFIAKANSAIKTFKSVLKSVPNTSKNVVSAADECWKELMAIIKDQSAKIDEINDNQFIGSTNSSINSRLDAIEKTNQLILIELAELKSKPNTTTYASIASTKLTPNIIKESPKNLIIIKPKDESAGCKQTQKLIKSALDSAQRSHNINNVKYLSKGGLLLNCDKPENVDQIKTIIDSQLESEVTTNKPQLKKPKIVLYGVDSEVTENTLIKDIIEYNREIKEFLQTNNNTKTEDHISINFKFRKHFKNSTDTNNQIAPASQINQSVMRYSSETWVLQVSPDMRKIISNMRSIRIGWQSCRVSDYMSITRCHNCNGFGHYQKIQGKPNCRSAQACGHCTQQHNTRDCKTPKTSLKCINCEKYNQNSNTKRKLNTNHSSFSNDCPSYKKVVQTIQSKIDYGY
jgi:hypothetical protein